MGWCGRGGVSEAGRDRQPDVWELLVAFGAAAGVVFVAEIGDKTQFLAMSFGSQFPLRRVALGLTLGYGAAGLVAVAVGELLGASLPRRPIEVAGGLLFVLFGVLSLRSDEPDTDTVARGSIARSSVLATISLTIFVGEMGDKTQIATATLAAQAGWLGTWAGATAGAVASGMIGAVAGTMLGDRVSPRALRWASATLFIAFGVAMLAGWP